MDDPYLNLGEANQAAPHWHVSPKKSFDYAPAFHFNLYIHPKLSKLLNGTKNSTKFDIVKYLFKPNRMYNSLGKNCDSLVILFTSC